MCFAKPQPVPEAPPVPSAQADEAKARIAAEQQTAQQTQGRQATILTSPLGAPTSDINRRRTTLSGS